MASIKTFDSPGTLMIKTYQLLRNDKRSLSDVSIDTGISFFWLQRFNASAMKNPSVNRVQYLYEQLSKTTLTVK